MKILLATNGLECLIDDEDFEFLSQWRWGVKFNSTGKKPYLYRITGVAGSKRSVFLHKVVLVRAKGAAPTKNHIIGDHCDGNSLNCQRSNLRWATRGMNRRNYNGVVARENTRSV